jgi:ABC-2 type transport system ATP-binding protein
VLVSSHLLSEVAHTVDDVVVISKGRLVRQAPLAALTNEAEGGGVRVRTPDMEALQAALEAEGLVARSDGDDRLLVSDATPEQVGRLISRSGLVVYEMSLVQPDLEDVFFELTAGHERSQS